MLDRRRANVCALGAILYELLERSLELYREVVGERDPRTMSAMNELALVYLRGGHRELPVPLYRASLSLSRKVLGTENSETLSAMNNLGVLYKRMGRYDEAEALYKETLAIRLRELGEEHPDTARR